MPDRIVTSHQLEGDVYTLVVGETTTISVPMLDDEGNSLLDDDGRPMVTTDTSMVSIEAFSFAADDERWQGKSDADIAAEQRDLVRETLTKRDAEQLAAQQAIAAAQRLPGVGDSL